MHFWLKHDTVHIVETTVHCFLHGSEERDDIIPRTLLSAQRHDDDDWRATDGAASTTATADAGNLGDADRPGRKAGERNQTE